MNLRLPAPEPAGILFQLFRFWVQTASPGDGTMACAYYIGAACTWKRKSHHFS